MADRQQIFDGFRLRFGDQDIERRRRLVGLEECDIPRITAVRDVVTRGAGTLTEAFFAYLQAIPEAKALFGRRDRLEEAKRLKREHLIAMVGGEYGEGYVQQRIKLAVLYSEAGIDACVFLGAFRHLLAAIGDEVTEHSGLEAPAAFDSFMALNKVGFFDIGLIVDVLIDQREQIIGAQQEAIRELSTPVLQLRDRLLVLPIIGVIDTYRAKQLTDSLLQAVRARRAKVVVMDVTGVAVVDSKVANHLIQTVAAARLMGAAVIITGLSADVAYSLVALGVDLSRLQTVGDLQGGLEEAERLIGYRPAPIGEPALRREPV